MGTTTFRRTNYSGYLVADRAALLTQLAAAGVDPAFENVIAEHVTYAYPDRHPAPAATTVRVVGHARGDGVQALLVEVDGTTARPGGGVFHLTYSLAPGHRPAESNAMLTRAQIVRIDPIEVAVHAF